MRISSPINTLFTEMVAEMSDKDQPNGIWQVKAFFNAIPKEDFIEILKHFSDGISRSYNEIYCIDREPGSIANGISFGVTHEEITLSNKDFLAYLEKACADYLQEMPQERMVVHGLLAKIKLRFPYV